MRRADPANAPSSEIRSASRSHVGHVRSINEDRTLDRADRGLWAVADGMGGHSAGDIAAETAIAALAALADGDAAITDAAILAALERVNAVIHARAAAGTSGTTIVVMHLVGPRATLFWAGDSRAYRIRGDAVDQLTTDHSLVQEMVDAGALSADRADRHPRANVITRALGVAPTVSIDRLAVDVAPGDRLLLCSDGLSRSWRPSLVPERSTGAIDALADRLLAGALERDGSDNISLVVVAPR